MNREYYEDALRQMESFAETFERCYADLLKPMVEKTEMAFSEIGERKPTESVQDFEKRKIRFYSSTRPAGEAAKSLSSLFLAMHDVYLTQAEELKKYHESK